MALKTLETFVTAVAARPAALAEERRRGAKVVGAWEYTVPEEVIHALGLIPVRLAAGGSEKTTELGARYISSKNCVFCRHAVGQFATKKDPYILNTDLFVFDATCLQLFRVAEIVKYYFNVPMLVLGVPKTYDAPEAADYFLAELTWFTKELETFAGRPLENERLAESIDLFRKIREVSLEIYRQQAVPGTPAISWREVFDVIQAGYVLDKQEYLALLLELATELKATPLSTERKRSNEKRIFLSGSLIPPKDRKLIEIIEDVGGRVIVDDLSTGLGAVDGLCFEEPTLRGVARAYLSRNPPHSALPYLDLATDPRLANFKRLIKEYDARAVIYHSLRFCDPYTFKAAELKAFLQPDRVPFLEIHTEYSGSDVEAIRTRVEALVETMSR
jgi:benzoyl-CoA reductase/2-hydroxyglutaryl-CoA dehydratase subunit BcrC/BadD/HgdB